LELSLLALAIVLTFILGRMDSFEWFHELSRAHEEWQLDELANFFFLSTICFVIVLAVRARTLGREIDRRRLAEAEASTLARHDPLTGIANRRLFGEQLERHVANARRNNLPLAVFIIDLNRFKAVNDVHGHAAGDRLLVAVAARLQQIARKEDTVARLGGDEFGLVLGEADKTAALRVAIRMSAAVEEPFRLGDYDVEISASIGIALYPEDAADTAGLVSRADLAMYRAKASRTNAYAFFDSAVDEALRDREVLQRDLKMAIDGGQIVPFYQPLIDLTHDRVIGFEVLARWQHPVRGLLPPELFIPIAEDSRLIGSLSMRLLQSALKDAANWDPSLRLSINVAPDQFRDRMLAERILGALSAARFSPTRLEVELTETALVTDFEAAREILLKLKAAGVRIAIDDFGKGYSSLSYLRELPFDVVKIDQSFVITRASNPESAKIVSAVIGLSEALGLETLAEGIETQADADWLRQQGCDAGQGFLYSQPMPAAKVPALLGKAPEAA
jgi:diguanylate cyclase (GGDEF)-like protein